MLIVIGLPRLTVPASCQNLTAFAVERVKASPHIWSSIVELGRPPSRITGLFFCVSFRLHFIAALYLRCISFVAGAQCGTRYWRPYIIQEDGDHESTPQARHCICGLSLRDMTASSHRAITGSRHKKPSGVIVLMYRGGVLEVFLKLSSSLSVIKTKSTNE